MLIEAMQKYYDSIDDTANFALHTKKSETGIRIRQAKYLLQKEQDQIEKAYEDGTASLSAMSGKRYCQSKYGD